MKGEPGGGEATAPASPLEHGPGVELVDGATVAGLALDALADLERVQIALCYALDAAESGGRDPLAQVVSEVQDAQQELWRLSGNLRAIGAALVGMSAHTTIAELAPRLARAGDFTPASCTPSSSTGATAAALPTPARPRARAARGPGSADDQGEHMATTKRPDESDEHDDQGDDDQADDDQADDQGPPRSLEEIAAYARRRRAKLGIPEDETDTLGMPLSAHEARFAELRNDPRARAAEQAHELISWLQLMLRELHEGPETSLAGDDQIERIARMHAALTGHDGDGLDLQRALRAAWLLDEAKAFLGQGATERHVLLGLQKEAATDLAGLGSLTPEAWSAALSAWKLDDNGRGLWREPRGGAKRERYSGHKILHTLLQSASPPLVKAGETDFADRLQKQFAAARKAKDGGP